MIGFSDDLLASTYSIASIGNGLLAIVAGFASQLTGDFQGDIGPFQLAIAVTVIALIIVSKWEENYGLMTTTSSSSFKEISRDSKVCLIGIGYSFFEGAMYTFGKRFF